MSRQVFILLEAIALAAMIALPPRWVKYGECCYGEGSIPGVNCCGRPELDPNQANLTRHRPCCDPVVFEAIRLDVVVSNPQCASFCEMLALSAFNTPALCVPTPVREILPAVSTTGSPPDSAPVYLLHRCILI